MELFDIRRGDKRHHSCVDRVIAELPAAGLAISVSTDDPSRFDYLMKP